MASEGTMCEFIEGNFGRHFARLQCYIVFQQIVYTWRRYDHDLEAHLPAIIFVLTMITFMKSK
jgi:hypothetical protein